MANNFENTMKIDIMEEMNDKEKVIKDVYNALKEKGYNPTTQMAGYLLSGDPTYITSHNNARTEIKKIERMKIIEELVDFYIKGHSI